MNRLERMTAIAGVKALLDSTDMSDGGKDGAMDALTTMAETYDDSDFCRECRGFVRRTGIFQSLSSRSYGIRTKGLIISEVV